MPNLPSSITYNIIQLHFLAIAYFTIPIHEAFNMSPIPGSDLGGLTSAGAAMLASAGVPGTPDAVKRWNVYDGGLCPPTRPTTPEAPHAIDSTRRALAV